MKHKMLAVFVCIAMAAIALVGIDRSPADSSPTDGDGDAHGRNKRAKFGGNATCSVSQMLVYMRSSRTQQ